MLRKLDEYLLDLCKMKDKKALERIPPENVEEAPPGMKEFKKYPHLFVLGAIMDRQIQAGKAWAIPYKVADCLGGKEFSLFANKDQEYYYKIFEKGPDGKKLHRYYKIFAKLFYEAIQDIKNKYGGDASNIWNDNPTSDTLIKRFEEFKGVGQKISTMAVNILRRDYNLPIDLNFIDISADVHVIRVFKRMGLVPIEDNELVIKKARQMNPEFPGIFDYVIWSHGVDICKSTPLCDECEFASICPKNI